MSVFDGCRVIRILEPRGTALPDWPYTNRVYAGAAGSLWARPLDALREYRSGRWVTRCVARHQGDRYCRRCQRDGG